MPLIRSRPIKRRTKIGVPNHSTALLPRKSALANTCSTFNHFSSSSSSSSFFFFFISFFFFFSQSPRPRVLHPIVSSVCLPTQIINRWDLCRFLESGPERKGGTPRCSSFFRLLATPVFFAHRPLDYLGSPINQVRASEYEMDIGCTASTLVFSTRKRVHSFLSPSLKTKLPPPDCASNSLYQITLA